MTVKVNDEEHAHRKGKEINHLAQVRPRHRPEHFIQHQGISCGLDSFAVAEAESLVVRVFQ
jgi:hypothetical protein